MRKVRRVIRKAQPTPGQVHINSPLTNISVAYMLDENLFLGHRAFGFVPVKKKSDLYWKFDKSDFLRDEAKQRAPATESAGGGYGLTTDSYNALVWAYHKDVDDQSRANEDSALEGDTTAVQWVTQKMVIRREKLWVASYFKAGVWATDITPGNLWSAANSTPQADVETGKNAILQSTGQRPNVLVLGPLVFSALKTNAEIKDRFKYTNSDSITVQMLAAYFEVDEVLIAYGIEATSAEGAAVTAAFIAGKHALLCYRAKTPSLRMPSAGYVMSWNQYAGSQLGASISKFRMQQLRADRVEAEFAFDMKVVSSDCGYFFNAVVA